MAINMALTVCTFSPGAGLSVSEPRAVGEACERAPRLPPPPRTKRTRRVPDPVLTGHAASLTPY